MLENLTIQAFACTCTFFLGEFYLFFPNKFFQINIGNIIPSSKTSHCNADWNCVKCDSFGKNWPLGNGTSSFDEMQWIPLSTAVPAASRAYPPTAGGRCWWGRRNVKNRQWPTPSHLGPLSSPAPLQAQTALRWPPASPTSARGRDKLFPGPPCDHCCQSKSFSSYIWLPSS